MQRAESDRFNIIDVNLIFAARFVNADGAAHARFQSVFGAEFQSLRGAAEADALHLCFLVLQREIEMPGLGVAEIGNFAFHPHSGKRRRKQFADAARQFADGPDLALGN